MLLSTDWFLPYWNLLNINVVGSARASIQQACRPIVKDMLGGATEYWLISFAEERLLRTQTLFDAAWTTHDPDAAASKAINNWALTSESDCRDGWLLNSLTLHLLRNRKGNNEASFESAILNALERIQERHPGSDIDLDNISMASKTEWDMFIRSITPDLPQMLGDYISVLLSGQHFRVIWSALIAELPESNDRDLVEWFRFEARAFMGADILPDYFSGLTQ
jgi:hypothetical protein